MQSVFDHPMVREEAWKEFTQAEHALWAHLYRRQTALLKSRVHPAIFEGIRDLDICEHEIPKFCDLNKILKKETNFSVIPVTGLIPGDVFFKFLAMRIFPSTCFIRKPEQMDYLQEPDIFHDVYGHVPLLVNPVFADFMELFGHKGLEALDKGLLEYAARLYWFTVEFGLIKTSQGLRIYGAGITSSKGESIYCLESEVPVRVQFDKRRTMKTEYHIDSYQQTYFVINEFKDLFDMLDGLSWDTLKDTLLKFPDIKQGVIINNNETINKDIK